MKRRLTSVLVVLSLILILATGVFWVRSYSVFDELSNPRQFSRGYGCSITSARGRLAFLSDVPEGAWPIPHGWKWKTGPASDYLTPKLHYEHFRSNGYVVTFIDFPHWSVMLVFAIVPTLRVWQLRRARKRQNENLCPTCGYDLRATPDRCPECGRNVTLELKPH